MLKQAFTGITLSNIQQKSHIVSIKGQQVQYWELHPEKPQTILMLKGFRSGDHGLIPFAQQFENYRVILPCYPGYGQSDELPGLHTAKAYAIFIEDFIHHLKLQKLIVIAHSFGTLVALLQVISNPQPIHKLVLITPIPSPNLRSRFASLYFVIGRLLPASLSYRWLTNRLFQNALRNYVTLTKDPKLRSTIMEEGEIELRELKPLINIQNFLSVQSVRPGQLLKQLATPTLIIAGTRDRLIRWQDIQATYQSPHITSTTYDMGHYAPLEIPAELAQMIKSWLSQTKTGRLS